VTDEDFEERVQRNIERVRPALERMARGPYPLEQQCPHWLTRQPRKGLVTRYLCRRCEGYHDQWWDPAFKTMEGMDVHVEAVTGGEVLSMRVRPLGEGEIDPTWDQGPGKEPLA